MVDLATSCSKHKNKLVITGCGRSGNSLMKELCHVGYGLPKTRAEQNPLLNDGVVFSYPRGSILIPKFLSNGMKVIFMLRNPAAVLISRHPYHELRMTTERWLNAVGFYEENKHSEGIILVKFENLVKNPNKVQKRIADRFDLKIKVPFDECWKSFDVNDRSDTFNMRGVRPMDKMRLEPWKYADKEQMDKLREAAKKKLLLKKMKVYGYDSSVLLSVDEAV